MADVAVLPTGGMESRGGGVNWLMVGGAAVVVVVFIVMMKRNSSGQPTTSAGDSINAALGSIQEQNLNIMGEVGQSASSLQQSVGDVNNNVYAARGELANYGNQIYQQAASANAESQQALTSQQQIYWQNLANERALMQNLDSMFSPAA